METETKEKIVFYWMVFTVGCFLTGLIIRGYRWEGVAASVIWLIIGIVPFLWVKLSSAKQ